jgi:hypothetical protein
VSRYRIEVGLIALNTHRKTFSVGRCCVAARKSAALFLINAAGMRGSHASDGKQKPQSDRAGTHYQAWVRSDSLAERNGFGQSVPLIQDENSQFLRLSFLRQRNRDAGGGPQPSVKLPIQTPVSSLLSAGARWALTDAPRDGQTASRLGLAQPCKIAISARAGFKAARTQ